MIRRIQVTGQVQGVWFRGWTVDQGRALGLDGWVRNRSDGSVEILAHGSEQALAELIRRCREGPSAAKVDAVTVKDADEAISPGFRQRQSA